MQHHSRGAAADASRCIIRANSSGESTRRSSNARHTEPGDQRPPSSAASAQRSPAVASAQCRASDGAMADGESYEYRCCCCTPSSSLPALPLPPPPPPCCCSAHHSCVWWKPNMLTMRISSLLRGTKWPRRCQQRWSQATTSCFRGVNCTTCAVVVGWLGGSVVSHRCDASTISVLPQESPATMSR